MPATGAPRSVCGGRAFARGIRDERGREGRRREDQERARERLRVVGLLEDVPTFDQGPPERRDGEG